MRSHFSAARTLATSTIALLLSAGCAGRLDTPPASAPDPASVAPALQAELRTELVRQLTARGITLDADGRPLRNGKAVSALPPRVYQTPTVQVNPVTSLPQLYWVYQQHGDYDLNGEVNISDITPVGQYFHAKTGDANWSQAQVADGDGNGEVNISDITPIGAGFGVRVDGFVIEAREAAGDWREYGHVPYSFGFPTGSALEFAYDVPSGAYEAEYRLAPVGRGRDFAWETYVLTDSSLGADSPRLAVADGKPVLVFVDTGSLGFTLGFAVGLSARPLNALQWSIEQDLGVSNAGDMPASLAVNQGKPCLAYCAFSGATYDTGFKVRDAGAAPTSTWSTHIVTTAAAASAYAELTVREGRPVILHNGLGLKLLTGQTAFPASAAEWTWISANPSLTHFDHMDAVFSGPWLFAAGVTAQSGTDLAFNVSTNPAPTVPADFTEYILAAAGALEGYPSLVMIGGVPCIAAANYTNETLEFFLATKRQPALGEWLRHTVASGSGVFRNPSMALVEGKPAIASGSAALDFRWTGSQYPDATDDWQRQQIDASTAPGGVSMVVTDGLPLIAYCVNTAGPSSIMIAVASEQ